MKNQRTKIKGINTAVHEMGVGEYSLTLFLYVRTNKVLA